MINCHRKSLPEPCLYGVTAFLALLMGMAAMAMAHMWPFGNQYMMWMDNGQQVASDFGYVRQIASGRSDLFWSYACGGVPRSSFHSTLNNLCSPLTWLVALIPGIGVLPKLSCLFLLQLAALPLGALFYVRRTFPRVAAPVAVLLALSYAFSEFLFTKHTAMMLVNPAIIFPFFLYGLDCLLKRGRWILYSFLLTIMLAAGTYFAYMWLLFAIVYAASRTGWRWHSPIRQHNALLLWATLLAIMMTAAAWLPSYFVTMGSARAGMNGMETWAKVEILRDVVLSPWLLPGAVAALLFFYQSSWRWSRYSLTVVVLMVGLAFASSTFVWHASAPICFPGRFSYMAVLMFICMGAMRWQRGAFVSTAVLGGRLLLLLLLFYVYTHYMQSGFVGAGAVLWLAGVGSCVYTWKTRHWVLGTTIYACTLTLGLFLHFFHNKKYEGCFQALPSRVMIAEDLAPAMDGAHEGTFAGRVKSPGNGVVDNVALYTSFESLAHFTASCTKENVDTLRNWGYAASGQIMLDDGGTMFSDTLFANKYFISGEKGLTDMPHMQKAQLWENPWHFGLGIMLPASCQLDMSGKTPLEAQIAGMQMILGEQAEWKTERHTIPALLQTEKWTYILQEPDCYAYGYDGNPYENYKGDRPNVPSLQLLPMNQSVKVWLAERGEQEEITTLTIQESTLEALKTYAQTLPVEVSYRGKRMDIRCESTSARNMLFLPLLWQDGYTATTADGTKLEVKKNGGFVSILFPEPGNHQVALEWASPVQPVGWALSGTGLLLLLCSLKWRCSVSHTRGSELFNKFCRQSMLACCFMLLFSPAIIYPLSIFLQVKSGYVGKKISGS